MAVNGLANGVVTVATGGEHTCALVSTGGVVCWGKNNEGQLGDGTMADRAAPTPVSGLTAGVVAVTVGSYQSFAILADGTAKAWGRNAVGQLGDGTLTRWPTPATITGLAKVHSISAGAAHACAVLDDGDIKCWGAGDYGQLGDGTNLTSKTPVSVLGLGDKALSVSPGDNHTCALLANQSVRCWGHNEAGQLGNGTAGDSSNPVTVSGLSAVEAMSVGGGHGCALLANGSVKCWGNNSYRQLGITDAPDDCLDAYCSRTPVLVPSFP